MLFFTPRGFVSVRVTIADYPGLIALVYVRRRVVIVNSAARPDAKIIRLCFGPPDPD